jgi:hypothetical protein
MEMAKTLKQLNARTNQLATTSAKLMADIHSHMVDIVEHVREHGDVTAATNLLNAIKNGVRRDAMANWFKAHGAMTGSQDDDGVFTMKRDKSVKLDAIDIDAARNETPWDLTPEKKWTAFDLNKAIAALVKRAEEKMNEEVPEGATGHKIDVDTLAKIKALAA